MPPTVLRYAITDRHLLPRDQAHREYLQQTPPTHSLASRQTQPQPAPEVTTSAHSAEHRAALLDAFRALALHLRSLGVDFLQLREKDLPAADLLAIAQMLRQHLPAGTLPRLLLNLGHSTLSPAELIQLALTGRFDGLHLPSTLPPELLTEACTRFADAGLPRPFLSASVHTPAELESRLGPNLTDLILFGPVFGKVVRGEAVQSPAGLSALAQAVQHASPTPVLALGGLNESNIADALATGAAGVASIRLFLPPHPGPVPPRPTPAA